MTTDHNVPFIDIKQVINSKNPTLGRLLPSFVLNYLKKIIHEDDINRFIRDNGHLKDHEFVNACFQEMGATLIVEGLEKSANPTSRLLIVAQHRAWFCGK